MIMSTKLKLNCNRGSASNYVFENVENPKDAYVALMLFNRRLRNGDHLDFAFSIERTRQPPQHVCRRYATVQELQQFCLICHGNIPWCFETGKPW